MILVYNCIFVQPPQITCHDVYSVRITSSSSTLQAGPFLPVLIDPIVQRFQLQEVGGLEKNRIYRAQLIAINENGETASNQSIPFSKLIGNFLHDLFDGYSGMMYHIP